MARRVLALVAFSWSVWGCALGAEWIEQDLLGRKALFVIAPEGFRDEELLVPATLLRQRGCAITIACSSLNWATGMGGTQVTPDVRLSEAHAAEYDAVVFVGGAGAKEYFEDEAACRLARAAASEGKVLAAIGVAPVILARAGVLVGKHVAAWRSQRIAMTHRGARWLAAPVFEDGNIVTASRPGVCVRFADAIARAMEETRP